MTCVGSQHHRKKKLSVLFKLDSVRQTQLNLFINYYIKRD